MDGVNLRNTAWNTPIQFRSLVKTLGVVITGHKISLCALSIARAMMNLWYWDSKFTFFNIFSQKYVGWFIYDAFPNFRIFIFSSKNNWNFFLFHLKQFLTNVQCEKFSMWKIEVSHFKIQIQAFKNVTITFLQLFSDIIKRRVMTEECRSRELFAEISCVKE